MYNCVSVVVQYIIYTCIYIYYAVLTIPRCAERDSVALFFENLRAVIIRDDIQCNGTVYVDGFRCHPFISPALPPVLDPLFFPLVLHILSCPSLSSIPPVLSHSLSPTHPQQFQVSHSAGGGRVAVIASPF